GGGARGGPAVGGEGWLAPPGRAGGPAPAPLSPRGDSRLHGRRPPRGGPLPSPRRTVVPALAGRTGPWPAQERDRGDAPARGDQFAGRARAGAPAMSVTLRPMGHRDVPAVVVLEQALFGEEAWSEDMVAEQV